MFWKAEEVAGVITPSPYLQKDFFLPTVDDLLVSTP
ncbi:hypothetical protein CGMCC3_g9560 [Colletotrichum fructicola]|nr:uncharacterized protein CGMCC3_g9560 [Colletotrichum fructicola]KAE9574360.1 hypothetical protein CGMCC3_g9560 [Colletotrichum fructicola]